MSLVLELLIVTISFEPTIHILFFTNALSTFFNDATCFLSVSSIPMLNVNFYNILLLKANCVLFSGMESNSL